MIYIIMCVLINTQMQIRNINLFELYNCTNPLKFYHQNTKEKAFDTGTRWLLRSCLFCRVTLSRSVSGWRRWWWRWWCRDGLGFSKKAVNSLLIVKESTAVGAPAGPRGFVLCRARSLFSLVTVCETGVEGQ